MTTTSLEEPVTLPESNSLKWAVSDTLTVAWRDLLALVRIPTSLVLSRGR